MKSKYASLHPQEIGDDNRIVIDGNMISIVGNPRIAALHLMEYILAFHETSKIWSDFSAFDLGPFTFQFSPEIRVLVDCNPSAEVEMLFRELNRILEMKAFL